MEVKAEAVTLKRGGVDEVVAIQGILNAAERLRQQAS